MKIFDEILTSYKGAGIIGTVVAVGTLIALGSMFVLASDDRFSSGREPIAYVIKKQEQKIARLKESVENTNQYIAAAKVHEIKAQELAKLKMRLKSCSEKSSQVNGQIAEHVHEAEQIRKELEKYRTKYRAFIRAKMIGANYPEIVTQSGRSYKNVTIRKIDHMRMSISHSEGSGSISWNELPNDLIDLLQLTQELANEQARMESGYAEHFSRAASRSQIQESMALVEEKIQVLDQQFENKRALVRNSQSIITQARADIQRLNAMIQQDMKRDGLRQTPRYKHQILENEKIIQREQQRISEFSLLRYAHQQQVSELRSKLSTMERELNQIKP
jgi:hypothetical protein